MRLKRILYFHLALFCYTINGQEITVFGNGDYYQDEIKLSFEEVDSIIKQKKEAKVYWLKANQKRKINRTLTLVWISSTIGSALAEEKNPDLQTSFGILTTAAILTNLFFWSSQNKYERKAILKYNSIIDQERKNQLKVQLHPSTINKTNSRFESNTLGVKLKIQF